MSQHVRRHMNQCMRIKSSVSSNSTILGSFCQFVARFGRWKRFGITGYQSLITTLLKEPTGQESFYINRKSMGIW